MSKKKKAAKKATKKIVKPATRSIAIRVLGKEGKSFVPATIEPQSTDIHVHAALTQGGNVGALGLLPITLSDKAELALSEPVNVEDIRVKPTGQAFLSHPTYTRWFNKAFGRLGWSLVPQSIPQVDKSGKRAQVMVLYTLYVGGKPAVMAYGEQEYFEDSSEQSRGDALEATVASALRRCAKRMGVGLEMWDKAYLDRFMKEACVKVKVRTSKWDRKENKKVDKLVFWWRRRVDVAFPGEVGQVSQDEIGDDDSQRRGGYADEYEPRAEAKRPAVPAQPRDERLITEPQRKRLYTIANNAGRTNAVVKAWLKAKYGVDSSTQIKWRDYDAIITALESEAVSLPL